MSEIDERTVKRSTTFFTSPIGVGSSIIGCPFYVLSAGTRSKIDGAQPLLTLLGDSDGLATSRFLGNFDRRTWPVESESEGAET